MGRETDGLADGRGAAVGEGHHPGLKAALGPVNVCDAGAEGEALKGLVKGDCDEEDDEFVADGDGESHADEDGVEEDTDFEHHALENVLLVLLCRGQDDTAVGVDLHGAVFLVNDDALLAALLLLPLIGLIAALWLVRSEDGLIGAAAHLAGRGEDHLDDGDEEDAGQSDGARHGGVVLDPKRTEAWVTEEGEGRRQEMDEGGGQKDAGAEMANGEEEGTGDSDAGDTLRDEREGASEEGGCEDDEEGADVEGRVVGCFVAEAAGRAG